MVTGRFVKVRVKPLERYGAYRRAGCILIYAQGIEVQGKHVATLPLRLSIAVALGAAAFILTAGHVILGLPPLYLLVEYVFLENGSRRIPWADVARYAVDEKRHYVAIETAGSPKHASPLVLKSDGWQLVLDAIRMHCPDSTA